MRRSGPAPTAPAAKTKSWHASGAMSPRQSPLLSVRRHRLRHGPPRGALHLGRERRGAADRLSLQRRGLQPGPPQSRTHRILVESLGELDIGNHHLVSAPRAALAEQLARLTPGHLAYTVFAVAGGEAIDLAIKVARATRRGRRSFRRGAVITAAPGWPSPPAMRSSGRRSVRPAGLSAGPLRRCGCPGGSRGRGNRRGDSGNDPRHQRDAHPRAHLFPRRPGALATGPAPS